MLEANDMSEIEKAVAELKISAVEARKIASEIAADTAAKIPKFAADKIKHEQARNVLIAEQAKLVKLVEMCRLDRAKPGFKTMEDLLNER